MAPRERTSCDASAHPPRFSRGGNNKASAAREPGCVRSAGPSRSPRGSARTRAGGFREAPGSRGSRQESIHPPGPVTGFKEWVNAKDEYSHELRKLTRFIRPGSGSPRGSRSGCRRFLRRQGEPCPRETHSARSYARHELTALDGSAAGDRFRPARRLRRKRIRHRTGRSRDRPSGRRHDTPPSRLSSGGNRHAPSAKWPGA